MELSQKDQEILEKRKLKEKKGPIPRDPSASYKLVCPTCEKPNAESVTFCTGCGYGLSPWDLEKQPENIFRDLIGGKDIGAKVLCRNERVIVFDDKFGVSDGHIDVIPVRDIVDITALTKEHIPLLKELYKEGLDQLLQKNLELYYGHNLEDYLTAGFNYPTSVPHLHLHMAVPPFKHKKVFQYPRWHSYLKVLNDLDSFGCVKTYDKFPNEEEGEQEYKRAIDTHELVVNMPTEQSYEDVFIAWRESKGNDCPLYWIEISEDQSAVQLSYHNDEFWLCCPTEEPDSVYFVDAGSLKSSWIAPVNGMLADNSSLSFCEILDKMLDIMIKSRKKQKVITKKTESFIGGDFDNFILNRNWIEEKTTHWLQNDLKSEITAASSFFGSGIISAFGQGSVSIKIKIQDVITVKIAEALEIEPDNPVFVHLDFSNGWHCTPQSNVPFPSFDVSQHSVMSDAKTKNAKQQTKSFGVRYHLNSIILRYVEDVWKWSNVAPVINLGSFTEAKGHNNDFNKWQSERKARGPKKPDPEPLPYYPQLPQNNAAIDSLVKMGFKKSASITALNNHQYKVEAAIEELIKMGPAAIEIIQEPAPTKALSVEHIKLITAMGFSRLQAKHALRITDNNVDNAITLLVEGTIQIDDNLLDSEEENMIEDIPSAPIGISETSLISKAKINFFVGLVSYVRSRLFNYCRYCMICHVKHSCRSEKPVVCCNPLCIFRYSELLPQEKKKKIREVDRITICPFTDCLNNIRDNDANQSILAALMNNVEMDDGNNQEALLEMHAHRYLPNSQILEFMEDGIKRNNVKIARIENILKPELVVRFEKRWGELKVLRGQQLAQPQIAYHGTAEGNIDSILDRGLLVPGMGEGTDVAHATDNGWWGKGIYLSPDSSLSIGYCRGGSKLLICSVLMGRPYNVQARMDGQGLKEGYDSHIDLSGKEWVIFNPAQVLPCYLISFKH
jgi:diadenosine tetraphosphate (Ap4A) HIT family hydrolase